MITDLTMIVDAATVECYLERIHLGISQKPAGVDYDVQLLDDFSVDLVITDPLDVLHSSAPVSL